MNIELATADTAATKEGVAALINTRVASVSSIEELKKLKDANLAVVTLGNASGVYVKTTETATNDNFNYVVSEGVTWKRLNVGTLTFPTRDSLVSAARILAPLPDGTVVQAGGLSYLKKAGATQIPDLHGYVPHGKESFGHYDGSYVEPKDPSYCSIEYIPKTEVGGLRVLKIHLHNINPYTLKKHYLGEVNKANRTATLAPLKGAAKKRGYRYLFNADAFDTSPTNKLLGLQVLDGEVLCAYHTGFVRDSMVMLRNGWLKGVRKTDNYTEQKVRDLGVNWACAFGPILVENGQITTAGNTSDTQVSARNVIGQLPNRDIIILQVEGITNSAGATLKQMSDMLIAEGCVFGFCLDGGGSLQTWWNGYYAIPSSDVGYTRERPVVSALEICTDLEMPKFITPWEEVELIVPKPTNANLPGVKVRQNEGNVELWMGLQQSFKANVAGTVSNNLPPRFAPYHIAHAYGLVNGSGMSFGAVSGWPKVTVRAVGEDMSYMTGVISWKQATNLK